MGVKIEFFKDNDRCEGASQSQTFKAGTCTKYNLVPGRAPKPIYIIASTQSSLRFQKWLFETSDEYWRLMQILKRRRKIRKERLDKSAKTTPAEEDNEKSLLRGKTNNQAIN